MTKEEFKRVTANDLDLGQSNTFNLELAFMSLYYVERNSYYSWLYCKTLTSYQWGEGVDVESDKKVVSKNSIHHCPPNSCVLEISAY